MKKEEGFTIIEALVTLVLLSLALVPMFYFTSVATTTSFYIRDDMISAHLAQEGLEVVRAMRDANWFNSRPFDSGLGDGVYRVEYNSNALIALGTNPSLSIANGVYSYQAGAVTPFQRTITITKINAGEIRVVAAVSRPTKGGDIKTISAESHLFDWK